MKKILGLFFVLAFTLVMASGAFAAASAISSTAGSYKYGSEWLDGQAGNLSVDMNGALDEPGGNPTWTSTVQYVPAIAIGINNTIRVKITRGAVKKTAGNVYKLFSAANGGEECANMTDFVADANGNYTEMLFQFVQTINGADAASVNSGVNVTMTEDAAGTIPPTFVTTNALLDAGDTTIEVSEAKDSNGAQLEAPKTIAAAVVITQLAQMSATVRTSANVLGNSTSVIDVEASPSRAKFVVGGDATLTTSEFRVLVASATVNTGVNLATAAYTLTVNGTQAGIDGVQLNGVKDFTLAGGVWTATSDFATHDLRVNGSNEIVFTVDGTTVLDPATFTVNLTIDPSEAGVLNKEALVGATADIWTVNAMQARIPYMLVDTRTTGNAGYSSFFEITNRSATSAKVTIDAIISNEDGSVNTTQTAPDILTVPANSVIIVRQSDLDTWFSSIDDTKLYRLGLVLTVVAAQNNVDVTAFHIGPGSRTNADVLYNTNNANDGRKWQ